MTLQHFAQGRFALVIPDAWTRWTVGSREYYRGASGVIGSRPIESAEPYELADVEPVDLTIRPARRKAVA